MRVDHLFQLEDDCLHFSPVHNFTDRVSVNGLIVTLNIQITINPFKNTLLKAYVELTTRYSVFHMALRLLSISMR